MSNPLEGLGLQPDPEAAQGSQEPADAAPAPEADPNPAPEAEAVPEPEEEIEVPEGAENPDAVRNAIKAERSRAREAYRKAKQLEEELKAREEASRPLEERLAEAQRKADEAALVAQRLEIGMRHGLSVNVAKRLVGSTVEELETDAKSLLEEIGSRGPSPLAGLTLDGGPAAPPATKPDPSKAHNQLITSLLGRG